MRLLIIPRVLPVDGRQCRRLSNVWAGDRLRFLESHLDKVADNLLGIDLLGMFLLTSLMRTWNAAA